MRYSRGERAQLLLIQPLRHTQCTSIHYGNDARTHYEVLGVRRDASLKEIKNAFYTLSKKYHPDVAGSSVSSASTTNFMVIKDAYDVLRDPEKRRAYDEQISIQNTSNFESPFYEGPFTSPFNVRHRTRAQPPRQSYTEAEYQRKAVRR
uniref:J domain-containing protein n=1 Tax=Parascaris univalens TaxID=6257 RepID=A0A914ZK82_PARUN